MILAPPWFALQYSNYDFSSFFFFLLHLIELSRCNYFYHQQSLAHSSYGDVQGVRINVSN